MTRRYAAVDPTRRPPARVVAAAVAAYVAGLATVVSSIAWSGPPTMETPSVEPVAVTCVPVSTTESRTGSTFTGVIRARDRVQLAFEVSGRITETTVAAGDWVQQGDVVAVVDAPNPTGDLDVARSELRQRQLELSARAERLRAGERLAEVGVAGREEIREQRYEVRIARARRAQAAAHRSVAEHRAEAMTLHAPVSGVVTEVRQSVGEVVVAGQPVLALEREGPLELHLAVPEDYVADLQPGQSVTLSLPRLPGSAAGSIRAVVSPVRHGLFDVIIDVVPTDDVFAGVTATLAFDRATQTALAVPVEAVVDPAGAQPSVFVVRDGVAIRVSVAVSGLDRDTVLVDASLTEGELVVTAGAAALDDGTPVRVTTEGSPR